MPQIVVDINTRLLTDSHQIFVSRPGKDYRLYPEVSENSVVLLELPALDLTPGVPIDDYTDLEQRIKRSKRIRNWHKRRRPEDDVPPRDLAEYSGQSLDRGEAQLQGLVRAMFDRAKKGDLVIVPPKSFNNNALVGEFLDGPGESTSLAVDRMYLGDALPARRVKWLASIPKRNLSPSILDAIQKPTSFFLLQKSLKLKIYEQTYASFIVNDQFYSCRFDVSAEDFSAKDDFLIQSFFNFVATNTKAVDENRLDQILGIKRAAFEDAGSYDPELRTNVNSPGWLSIFSRHATPLVAASLLSIAIEIDPAVAVDAAKNEMITLGNSNGSADCVTPVHKHVLNHIKLLGLDQWPEACEIAKKAVNRSGLKSPTKADVRP